MARTTAANAPSDVTMVARNQRVSKHPLARKLRTRKPLGFGSERFAGLQPERGGSAVLGAPGGSRAAHVVQFRPVGVERLGEELAPEGLETGKRGLSGVAGGRGGNRGRRDGSHDAFSLFSFRGLCRAGRFLSVEHKSWLDLLKEAFNCRDRAHTWCRSSIHPW